MWKIYLPSYKDYKLLIKLDTYLHLLWHSSRKKLCLFACICQSFLVQLLVYPVNVFCLGMPDMQVSDMCL